MKSTSLWFCSIILALMTMVCGCRTVTEKPLSPSIAQSPPGLYENKYFAAQDTPAYWTQAKEFAYKSFPELVEQHQQEIDKNIEYHKLMHGDTGRKQIALTFDDGPHPYYTPKLLAILKQYQVKATFFVVGKMAELNPQLVQAEFNAGHAIGNHTFHHVNLTKIPQEYIEAELKADGDLIKDITGSDCRLFRPPGGDYNHQVAEIATALNYLMVLWTDDPGDYANPGTEAIETRTLKRVSNGGIILLHDGIQQTLEVLPQIIQYLKNQGFEFITPDEMEKGLNRGNA